MATFTERLEKHIPKHPLFMTIGIHEYDCREAERMEFRYRARNNQIYQLRVITAEHPCKLFAMDKQIVPTSSVEVPVTIMDHMLSTNRYIRETGDMMELAEMSQSSIDRLRNDCNYEEMQEDAQRKEMYDRNIEKYNFIRNCANYRITHLKKWI